MWAESVQAGYDVEINGEVERHVLDQTAVDGWTPIARLNLEVGDSVEVRLDDNTGEPNSDEVRLVADAIRFVPTGNGEPQDPLPDVGMGPAPDAGLPPPVRDMAVEPGPRDAGMDAEATGSPQSPDGEGMRGHDGCDIDPLGDRADPIFLFTLLVLVAGGARRRSRRTQKEC